jgi:hypothetical protein
LGLVRDEDIMSVARLPDVEADEEMEDGWDSIIMK